MFYSFQATEFDGIILLSVVLKLYQNKKKVEAQKYKKTIVNIL